MDKNFRILGKVSIVDIFLLICLIVGIYFLYRLSEPDEILATGEQDSANTKSYTIEISNQEDGLLDGIETDVPIYDATKGNNIGTIIDVYSEPYMSLNQDLNTNEFVEVGVEGRSNYYIVVEGIVSEAYNATSINGLDLMVGTPVNVKSKDFAGSGYIVRLER